MTAGFIAEHHFGNAKLLIANRGEIAVRIVRACRQLGLRHIIAFSEADRSSLAVRMADEAICIGAAPVNESYLRVDRLISVANLTGVTAIHPGYGFLSENPHFAQVCQECGYIFVGPSANAISMLGDKARARKCMQEAGIPVTPGSDGVIASAAEAAECAGRLGYPVILKAVAGGGGKGMRVVEDPARLSEMFNMATAEAKSAFGNPSLYMEKYLPAPRHVEVQIIADNAGNVLCLGDRDCSWQRHHQKLIEESPCPVLPANIRGKMYAAAIKAVRKAGYTGVGTVEYLFIPTTGEFYFMEMNTRLQVEHPVTEETSGIDLVAAQILVAFGETLPWRQTDIASRGHAIEVRINAEKPGANFAPCPGKINFFQAPGGPGIRVDTHIYDGYVIPPYYDSLVAKVIASGENRETARRRMIGALRELTIDGIDTTAEFARELMETQEFTSADYDTGTLNRLLNQR